jgi:hypothetical protein
MPTPQSILGVVGDVLYHLFCQYHGALGTATTPESAAQAAADHLRAQHTDAQGVTSPHADVQVTLVSHITPAHFEQIEQAKQTFRNPGV